MTIEMCYRLLQGNYNEIFVRLHSRDMIERYSVKFIGDTSFNDLVESLEKGEVESAFRFAHNLKGVCANLSFTYLQHHASIVTEFLRAGDLESAKNALPELEIAYTLTIDVLTRYKAEKS